MRKKITITISLCVLIFVAIIAIPILHSHTTDKQEATKQISIGIRGGGSDIYGVKLHVSINEQHYWDIDSEKPTLIFQWLNQTETEFSYPLSFDILKQENDQWVSCATEEINFPTAFETVAANSSARKEYSVKGFNLHQNGLYRFIVKISDTENIWYDFQVDISEAG